MNQEPYTYGGYQESSGFGQSLSYDQYLSRTFRWMTVGLLVSFGMACTVAYTNLFFMVQSLYLPLTIGELILVVALSAQVNRLQVNTARILFLTYSALNGMVLSIYFVMFSTQTLVMAFMASALYFGIMALYGHRTQRDLLSWGPRLSAALIAMLVCSVVGLLFHMSFLSSMLYSALGLGLFLVITARDMQMISANYQMFSRDPAMLEKSAVYSALSLYLDFIDIFLYVLRFMAAAKQNDD